MSNHDDDRDPLFLWMQVLWDDREKIIWWHMRWHLAGVAGIFWIGQQLTGWLID